MKTIPLLLALTATSAFSQGPLDPSAAPAPTMKSLDQIEARTPIPAGPAVPIAGPHFTITQPGSYYLTGNVTVTSSNAILITTPDVTLDLNGFTIASTLTGANSGAAVQANNLSRITVRNGNIRSGTTVSSPGGPAPIVAGFTFGVRLGSESLVSGVHVSGVGINSINLFRRGIIENCTVISNGSDGIIAEEGSISRTHVTLSGARGIYADKGNVTNCTANSNHTIGIMVGYGNVSFCTATSNGSSGIYVYYGSISNSTATYNLGTGILAALSSVTNCAALYNDDFGISAYRSSVTNSTAAANGTAGIYAQDGNVTNSLASGNFKNGIRVGAGVVAHCVASENSTDPATVDKEIEVSAFPAGQRIGCVPATE